MGVIEKVKTYMFGSWRGFKSMGGAPVVSGGFQGDNSMQHHGDGIAAATSVNSSLAQYMISISQFEGMNEEDIYEQLIILEPEISAAIVKISDMCRSSYKCFKKYSDDEIKLVRKFNQNTAIDDMIQVDYDPKEGDDSLEEEMEETANMLSSRIAVENCFEVWPTIMYSQGYIALEKKDLSLIVLPNNRISFVERLDQIGGFSNTDTPNYLMTDANYLIIDEGFSATRRVLPREQFIIIKISDIPVHSIDRYGRKTFGIYPVSPLQRAVIPVWMKRQVQIIDILWRWANVPREHHMISAEAFNLKLYGGLLPADARKQAERDLGNAIQNYASKLKSHIPDQAYVTSSNVEIANIEHSSTAYMGSNELLSQIQESIWCSLNVPKSFVTGDSDSSYASETIMSYITSLRIRQICERVGAVVLENMKERLLSMNPNYPVDKLDIQLSFDVSESKLEKFKRVQLMASTGAFTLDELREEVDFPPMTDEQFQEEGLVNTTGRANIFTEDDIKKMVKILTTPPPAPVAGGSASKGGKKKAATKGGKAPGKGTSSGPRTSGIKYPSTPRSNMAQGTSSPQARINSAMNPR